MKIESDPAIPFGDFVLSFPPGDREPPSQILSPPTATANRSGAAVRGILNGKAIITQDRFLGGTVYGKAISVIQKTTDLTPDSAVGLQEYPHVLKRLKIGWGDPECFHMIVNSLGIMESALADPKNRSQRERQGFSTEAMNEIAELLENHDARF
jgi:hypothetical protein